MLWLTSVPMFPISSPFLIGLWALIPAKGFLPVRLMILAFGLYPAISRIFVAATENMTMIPVFARPLTRMVPRFRFSVASFFRLPKNPSTKARRDID